MIKNKTVSLKLNFSRLTYINNRGDQILQSIENRTFLKWPYPFETEKWESITLKVIGSPLSSTGVSPIPIIQIYVL